jgi:(1->4)-alpha-D-glucan 1-alpha-D-glucosylmutase
LQLHKDFGFPAAGSLAAYLQDLGVSHVYASPFLKAKPGSAHGYDIVDHLQLNPELGTAADFEAMVGAFRAHGLGLILDFVPNHMGIGGADNPLWLDVLEFGRHSAWAPWFDIDWHPDNPALHGKLLVPVLGDQYGVELEAGKLVLKFDATAGSFAVWAYDTHQLPIFPRDYKQILGEAEPRLAKLGARFGALAGVAPDLGPEAAKLKLDLAALVRDDAEAFSAVEAAVATFEGRAGEAASFAPLEALVARQNWRAAHHRVAGDEINYRRFFNINELAGLRMERDDVFDHAHRLVLALVADGTLQGLRLDHIDGLLDPKAYLEQLRRAAGPGCFIVVEKILMNHEHLRSSWPIQGTTGYDFLNLLLGLFIDPAQEAAFDTLYADFAGDDFSSYEAVVRASKMRVLENELASELSTLGREAARIARQTSRTADFTRSLLQRGLKAIVACFPVYRCYLDKACEPDDADKRDLAWAVAHARRMDAAIDPSVFDFLHRLLGGELGVDDGFDKATIVGFAMRVQQYTGPVMAKGVEDTAFYRYNRFVALNEVGGRPEAFGVSLAAWHNANIARVRSSPASMLATATHDTKRGEDTRARLAALSELPDEWSRAVTALSRILRARLGDVEGSGPPDRNDEYLFFQLLVGTWPLEFLAEGGMTPDRLRDYSARLEQAMIKSLREAKHHSSWILQDTDYESGVVRFVREALDPDRSSRFLEACASLVARIAPSGIRNSLAQTVLKLTAPGVPDLYQGTELWDFSLVDPDNRRPVDYEARRKLLTELGPRLAADRLGEMARLMEQGHDGAVKLAVIVSILAFRRDHADLFERGGYEALSIAGESADSVVAFARQFEADAIIVCAARFPARLDREGPRAWLELPSWAQEHDWHDLLTGRRIDPSQRLELAPLLAPLPAMVLARR